MATIQDAILELIEVVSQVKGINHAPKNPEMQIRQYPAAVIYASDGIAINEPSTTQKDLHSIQIAVLMPLNDLRQCMITMLPLYEPITSAIFNHNNGRTSNNYQTFGTISYSLGPIDWPQGDVHFGWLFTINEVKIQNDL